MKYAIVMITLLLLNLVLMIYPILESYKPAQLKRVLTPKKDDDDSKKKGEEDEKKRKVKEEMEKIRKRAASKK